MYSSSTISICRSKLDRVFRNFPLVKGRKVRKPPFRMKLTVLMRYLNLVTVVIDRGNGGYIVDEDCEQFGFR